MTYTLYAQEAAAPPAAPAADGKAKALPPNPLTDPMFMLLMGALVVVMFVLPARRQRKEQDALKSNLKRGAKVLTVGGILGTVVGIKDNEDEITLKSEDSKIKVTKSSIARILGTDDGEAAK